MLTQKTLKILTETDSSFQKVILPLHFIQFLHIEDFSEVPNLSQKKTAPQLQSSLPEVDALPNLKLYLERGIVDLKINGQRLRLENINGVWRNDPVIDYYLTCQLEADVNTLPGPTHVTV